MVPKGDLVGSELMQPLICPPNGIEHIRMPAKILRRESEVSQRGIEKLLRVTTQLFLRILEVETQGLRDTAEFSHR